MRRVYRERMIYETGLQRIAGKADGTCETGTNEIMHRLHGKNGSETVTGLFIIPAAASIADNHRIPDGT